MRLKLRKRWKPFLILSVILTVLVFGMYKNNREHWEGMLDDPANYAWQDQGDGTYRMQCFTEKVGKGKYSLEVVYHSKGELKYELLDLEQDNGENQLGKVISSGILRDGESGPTEEFTLSKASRKLTLYVTTTDPNVQMGYWIMKLQNNNRPDYLLIWLSMMMLAFVSCILMPDWKDWRSWAVVLLSGLLTSMPYFCGFLNTGHDIGFHLERIIGMTGAMESGQFPVRLSTAFMPGYGFSVDMLYPELFLYIPAILCILGVSLMTSYKFLMILINLAVACVGYVSFRNLLRSDRMGLCCMLLYLLNPYRLVNMYCRAAVGEMLAQIFLPLLLWGVYELICGDQKKWWITVLAATGIIQSHIISVEISVLFVAAGVLIFIPYRLYRKTETPKNLGRRMLAMGKAAGMTILLNLWFLIPFLSHVGDDYYIKGQGTDMQNSALEIGDIFRLFVEYEGSSTTEVVNRQLFISIGPVLLLGIFVYSYYAFYRKSLDSWVKRIGNVCLGFGIVSCYLCSSAFPWNVVKDTDWLYSLLGLIQFPWRFLAYASLFLSVVTAIAVIELLKDRRQMIAGVLVVLTFVMSVHCVDEYLDGKVLLQRKGNLTSFDTDVLDYYQEDTPLDELWAQGDTVKSDQPLTIEHYERKGVEFSLDLKEAKEGTVLQLPIYNYELHGVYLDGEALKTTESASHQVQVQLPKGKTSGHLEVRFEGRKIYRVGEVVSLLTILGWIGYLLWKRKGRQEW